MFKLHQDKQINITKENLSIILAEYGISDFQFSSLSEGIANTSVVVTTPGKKYVLRIYANGKNTDENINYELEFQDYVREHGIPIPLVYKNENNKELTTTELDGKKWQSILMEFVEGNSVTMNPSSVLITELATIQAKMHQLGIEYAAKINASNLKWSDLHDGLAEKVPMERLEIPGVKELIERVKTYRYILDQKLPHGFNHLDLDFDGNVITKDNKVQAVIDFEDLNYSPVVVCLGFTLWNILDDQGLEMMKLYLSAYEKMRPLDSSEREALPHVIFFRNYAIGMIRLLLWQDDTDIKDMEDILQLEKDIPKLTFI